MNKCTYESDFLYPMLMVEYHWFNQNYPTVHIHNYWEAFLVFEGNTVHNINGETHKMEKGDGCLIRPSDQHCLSKSSKDYRQINFMITPAAISVLFDALGPNLHDNILNSKKLLTFNLNEVNDKLFYNNISLLCKIDIFNTESIAEKEKFARIIKSQFSYIANTIVNTYDFLNDGYPQWLSQFISDIKKEENISLKISELCKLTNYSHSHLIKLFHKYTNQTLVSFIRDIKLEYATSLLIKTSLPILYISSLVGYDSLSHFMKEFKLKYNITPGNIRKKNIKKSGI